MDQNTQDFIQTKRLAVVGVSRSAAKFGTTIYTDLKARGYEWPVAFYGSRNDKRRSQC
jgi:predicted CoA-binding protein